MKKKKFVTSKGKIQASKWELVPVPESMKIQHGISMATMPVPKKEAKRITVGQIHHGELSRWIKNYSTNEELDTEDLEAFQNLSRHLELYQEAVSAMEEHNAVLAYEKLKELGQLFPNDKMAKLNLATYHLQNNFVEEAEAVANEIESLYANNIRFMVLKARIEGKKGNKENMIAILHQAYRINPKDYNVIRELQAVGELVPVVFNADDLLQSRFVTRTKYSEMIREHARKLIRTKNWAEAAKLAKYHIEDRKPEIATVLSEQILEHDPENEVALQSLAYGLMAMKKLEKAEAKFHQLLEKFPNNYKAHTGLARVYFDTARLEDGIGILNKAMELDMEKTEAPELAILAKPTAEERMALALEIAQKYPDSWVPKKLIADLEFGAGEIKDALEKHQEVFEASSSDDALTMILHELDNLNRLEEAVSFLHNIKDLGKRSAAVRWNAANVYLKAGRVKPAVSILQTLQNDRELPHETRFSATVLLSEVYQTLRGQ